MFILNFQFQNFRIQQKVFVLILKLMLTPHPYEKTTTNTVN